MYETAGAAAAVRTLLEFECAAASPARAPIRAPRRATTTSSSRAKHHHERAGAADALGGTATLREFFAGRCAARTWRMRIDAPSNFPRRPRASHQVPGGMVLWSTSYRPSIGSHTKNDPSRIGSEALDFAPAPPAPTTRVRIRRERGVSTKKRELSLPLPTPLISGKRGGQDLSPCPGGSGTNTLTYLLH